MLIEFGEELVKALKNSSFAKKKEKRIVNSIIKTMINQQHIVIAEIEQLENLISYDFIESDNKAVLNWIITHYAEILSIVDKITYKICVVPSGEEIIYENEKVYVPLEKMDKISQTIISAENKTDADFYIEIANAFLRKERISEFVEVSFSKHSLFGGNCDKAIEEIFDVKPDVNPICLCIVDSDKEFEEHPGGETARKVRTELEKYKNRYLSGVLQLDVREKENMIPPRFYKYCHKSLYDQFHFFETYEESNITVLKYYDIKEGISVKNYKNGCSIWHQTYDGFLNDCYCKGFLKFEYSKINEQDEKHSLIQGVGKDMVDVFTRNILKQHALQEYNYKENLKKEGIGISEEDIGFYKGAAGLCEEYINKIPNYLEAEWERIYKMLLNWGCTICDLDFLSLIGKSA